MSKDHVRSAWEHNAGFWDEYFGESGNLFHRLLISPAVESLLGIQKDDRVIDIACGNGVLARRLADLGARVVAFDFSEEFVKRARARGTRRGRIQYRVADATHRGELVALGRDSFDAAVANMAVMDMSAIDPLFGAVSELLKPDGRFVFSLTHPCFNAIGTSVVGERREDAEGMMRVKFGVTVRSYKTPTSALGTGIKGQPVAQVYFHRSLSTLFQACFTAGLVIDGLVEPSFPSSDVDQPPFSWMAMPEIPPILVVRARRLA